MLAHREDDSKRPTKQDFVKTFYRRRIFYARRTRRIVAMEEKRMSLPKKTDDLETKVMHRMSLIRGTSHAL